jgi:hypothetical protein
MQKEDSRIKFNPEFKLDHDNPYGTRWYDPTKVNWALAALLTTCISSL